MNPEPAMTDNTENEAQRRAHLIHKDAVILFLFYLFHLLYSGGKWAKSMKKFIMI